MNQAPNPNLPEFDADMIARTLPSAQYNPYRIWFLGDTSNRTAVKVLQIKAADDFSLCAAPSLGIVVTGQDYLQTQASLRTALLSHMNKPDDTQVAITCTAPFNLSGDTLVTRDTDQPQTDTLVDNSSPEKSSYIPPSDDPLAAIAVPGDENGEPLEADLAEQFGLNF